MKFETYLVKNPTMCVCMYVCVIRSHVVNCVGIKQDSRTLHTKLLKNGWGGKLWGVSTLPILSFLVLSFYTYDLFCFIFMKTCLLVSLETKNSIFYIFLGIWCLWLKDANYVFSLIVLVKACCLNYRFSNCVWFLCCSAILYWYSLWRRSFP